MVYEILGVLLALRLAVQGLLALRRASLSEALGNPSAQDEDEDLETSPDELHAYVLVISNEHFEFIGSAFIFIGSRVTLMGLLYPKTRNAHCV
jgi:dsRNA-specific ribonuclease